jgi:hypothetical protein
MDQCNSCGAFEGEKCFHCPTLVCARCRKHHESICEENQKRIARGEGPTVRNFGRRVIQIPSAAPVELVDAGLAGVADLLKSAGIEVETKIEPGE